jgi:hypothetical protein
MATLESIAIRKEKALKEIDDCLASFDLDVGRMPRRHSVPAILIAVQLEHVAKALHVLVGVEAERKQRAIDDKLKKEAQAQKEKEAQEAQEAKKRTFTIGPENKTLTFDVENDGSAIWNEDGD